MLEYQLYKFGEFLACSLPWNMAYKIGIFLSKLQFYISKKDREAVINNLRLILPNESEAEIRKRAREVFVNFGLYLIEFFRFANIDLNYVKKKLTIKGRENIDNALKEKKGGILLTGHFGNWEMAGMVLSLLGYPIMAIALDHSDRRVNNFFKKRRESKGMEVVSLGISIKQCYKGLRNNKLVAILGDRDFSNSSYSLDFLGRKKNIPRGPAVLALRTGAPIIPVIVTRQAIDRLMLECLSPIRVSNEYSEIEIMKAYIKIFESQIYKKPTQWLLFREFWKE
ncbi:MAG: lysophospholipid acyltransferase family protein [Candidatus Omnitrophica bacterium]|nr:lysophospholipid acyltransferase family protein [Candidatus Omnitrophota bacterium]